MTGTVSDKKVTAEWGRKTRKDEARTRRSATKARAIREARED